MNAHDKLSTSFANVCSTVRDGVSVFGFARQDF